jgi:hypothetical protein
MVLSDNFRTVERLGRLLEIPPAACPAWRGSTTAVAFGVIAVYAP